MLIELQRDNALVCYQQKFSLSDIHSPVLTYPRQTALVLSFLCKHSIHVLMLHKQFNVFYLLFAFARWLEHWVHSPVHCFIHLQILRIFPYEHLKWLHNILLYRCNMICPI